MGTGLQPLRQPLRAGRPVHHGAYAEKTRAEGGGGDYGPNSGGYDQLGFGTLTSTQVKAKIVDHPSALASLEDTIMSWFK